MIKKLKNILFKIIYNFFSKKKFPFIQGHENLSKDNQKKIQSLVGKIDKKLSESFEKEFSNLIGSGYSTSFASGRMAFYSLLKSFGIKEGDEIIIQAATCAVMINTIIRLGAKPIYSDIDINTYSTCLNNLKKLITHKTKVVVIQHTFGIPGDILPILNFIKQKNLILIEDCALTLGSQIKNQFCGDIGHASIFSTDHSKPINTLIGGIAYTKNRIIYNKLKDIQKKCPELSLTKQMNLWKQLIFEKKFYNYKLYKWSSLYYKLFFDKKHKPFLDDDFGVAKGKYYAYPAKQPVFLSLLGIIEIGNFKKNYSNKIEFFKKIIILLQKYNIKLPLCYFDKDKKINPLRIFWIEENETIRNRLNKIIDKNWFWFQSPIAEASEPISNYFYIHGTCKITENIGSKVINLPCNMHPKYYELFLLKLENILKSYK